MTTHRRRSVAGALAAVAVAALTACGGSGGGAGAGELRLGYFPNITHAPALIGVAEGIFAEHLGPDVRLVPTTFNAGPSAIEALFSGAIDATYIGPNPAINGWAQSRQAGGAALHIIAGTTSGGAGLVVRPEIGTAADLRGTRIASPQLGNTQDVALRHWLGRQGLATDESGGGDVSVVPLPNSEIITAYGAGELAGAWVPEPHLSRLVVEHGARLLVNEADEWPDGRFVTAHLIVRAELLADNPDLLTRLLRGHLAAVDLLNEDPDRARATAAEHLAKLTGGRLPDDVVAAAFDNLTFTVDPVAASLYGSAAHATEVGLLEPVDLTGIYRLDLLNDLLRAAGRPPVAGDPS